MDTFFSSFNLESLNGFVDVGYLSADDVDGGSVEKKLLRDLVAYPGGTTADQNDLSLVNIVFELAHSTKYKMV